MSDRNITLGMSFQADLTQARRDWEAFVKDVQGRAVSIPLGGGGGASAIPSHTLGGLSVASVAAPNIATMFGQLGSQIAQAITAALRGGSAGGMGGSGFSDADYAVGAGIRSRAFAWASRWDRVDTSVRRARLGQNLGRTMGTYGDPAVDLDEAISEGAMMEEGAYPAAIAAANARRAGAGRRGFSIRGLGRLAYRFGAVYTAYEAVNAAAGYGINSRLMGIAGSLGTQSDFESAEARRYEGVVGAFGPVGALADLFVGGSATIASNQYVRHNNQASFESANRMATGASEGELIRARLRQSTQLSGVRNPFDVQKREAFNDLQNERLKHEADMRAMSRQRMFFEDTGDYRAARAVANEIDAAQTQYERTEDASLPAYKARTARIESDRGFAQRIRDIGYAGTIASNRFAALNNPLGASLAGIYATTQQQLTAANAQGYQQDYAKIIAAGVSEGFKELATAGRSFGIEVTSLQGSAASAGLRARHLPLEAQLRDIETERRVRLAQVPTGFLSDLLGGQQLRDSINDEADARRREVRTNRADQGRLIDIGQGGRENRLNALLRRSELGADASSIGAGALSEAAQLEIEGRKDKALRALRIGALGLDVLRRNALDSFEPTTLPAQNFETRPLGQKQADFGQQLQDIEDVLKDLLTETKKLNDS